MGKELTNWSKRCDNSGEHFQTVNSDIRKAEYYSIIVSHTKNLAGLGDAKGMGALRDESMLEVEILGEYNAETERATPRFEALVKLPGQSLPDRTLVKLTKHRTPEPTASSTKPAATETDSDYLERTYKLEFDLSKPEPSEPSSEPLNRPQDNGNSESEHGFTALKLTREQAIELIQRLRTELNPTQIIERLWDCKKGGLEAWKKAYARFKELMGGK